MCLKADFGQKNFPEWKPFKKIKKSQNGYLPTQKLKKQKRQPFVFTKL
jgi:hypothetical protein